MKKALDRIKNFSRIVSQTTNRNDDEVRTVIYGDGYIVTEITDENGNWMKFSRFTIEQFDKMASQK